MPDQFKIGDLVRVQGHASVGAVEAFMDAVTHLRPDGVFEIVARLPEVNGQPQYRVRGREPYERLVRASQLIPADRVPQPRR